MATVSTIPRQAAANSQLVGQILTVAIPGELTRAEVVEVIDDDTIRAKIVQTPMAKSHTVTLGQVLRFCRTSSALGQKWEYSP